jgi:predicted metal-dependent hydrolase
MDINEGIKLFNDGDYFEAHDYFEEMWANDRSDKKIFYHGLVQVSVGTYHLSSKNYNGALSQYSKGLEKLEKYPKKYESINLLKFKEEIKNLIEQITVFFSKKSFKLEVTKIPFIEQYDKKT